MAEPAAVLDLMNLSGPLTVEAILRALQQRFTEGHCYVSVLESAQRRLEAIHNQ